MHDLKTLRQRLEHALATHLPDEGNRLNQAMRYALLEGGKRLRALLLYSSGLSFAIKVEENDLSACAVEAIHAYSLIHDDLPAMDDDDLRRGKPSCHRAFDEATAILAGDALQSFAFECLTRNTLAPEVIVRQVNILAKAAGKNGMVLGQTIDMQSPDPANLATLENIHRLKTARLIQASLLLGAAPSPDYLAYELQLQALGETLGIGFQIVDDILDCTQESQILGKSAGKDNAQNKLTYPRLLGLTESKKKAQEYYQQAQMMAGNLPSPHPLLLTLIDMIFQRDY